MMLLNSRKTGHCPHETSEAAAAASSSHNNNVLGPIETEIDVDDMPPLATNAATASTSNRSLGSRASRGGSHSSGSTRSSGKNKNPKATSSSRSHQSFISKASASTKDHSGSCSQRHSRSSVETEVFLYNPKTGGFDTTPAQQTFESQLSDLKLGGDKENGSGRKKRNLCKEFSSKNLYNANHTYHPNDDDTLHDSDVYTTYSKEKSPAKPKNRKKLSISNIKSNDKKQSSFKNQSNNNSNKNNNNPLTNMLSPRSRNAFQKYFQTKARKTPSLEVVPADGQTGAEKATFVSMEQTQTETTPTKKKSLLKQIKSSLGGPPKTIQVDSCFREPSSKSSFPLPKPLHKEKEVYEASESSCLYDQFDDQHDAFVQQQRQVKTTPIRPTTTSTANRSIATNSRMVTPPRSGRSPLEEQTYSSDQALQGDLLGETMEKDAAIRWSTNLDSHVVSPISPETKKANSCVSSPACLEFSESSLSPNKSPTRDNSAKSDSAIWTAVSPVLLACGADSITPILRDKDNTTASSSAGLSVHKKRLYDSGFDADVDDIDTYGCSLMSPESLTMNSGGAMLLTEEELKKHNDQKLQQETVEPIALRQANGAGKLELAVYQQKVQRLQAKELQKQADALLEQEVAKRRERQLQLRQQLERQHQEQQENSSHQQLQTPNKNSTKAGPNSTSPQLSTKPSPPSKQASSSGWWRVLQRNRKGKEQQSIEQRREAWKEQQRLQVQQAQQEKEEAERREQERIEALRQSYLEKQRQLEASAALSKSKSKSMSTMDESKPDTETVNLSASSSERHIIDVDDVIEANRSLSFDNSIEMAFETNKDNVPAATSSPKKRRQFGGSVRHGSNKLMFSVAIMMLMCLALPSSCLAKGNFLLGTGIYDITGPAAQINFLGYANPKQNGHGIHTRLRSRAFIISEPVSESNPVLKNETQIASERTVERSLSSVKADPQKTVCFVSADVGMGSDLLNMRVAQRLDELLPTEPGSGKRLCRLENLSISGTSTHSTAGGYLQYVLYQVTSLGYSDEAMNAYVEGIAQSVLRAYNNVGDGDISLAQDLLFGANINRSPTSYLLNPQEERDKYKNEGNTEKRMLQLKFTSHSKGKDVGVLNWFAVLGTSLNSTNQLISSDNKGYASYLMEKHMNGNETLPGQGDFVAAFASTNLGDATPNMRGAACLDTGRPCDGLTSTCNGRPHLCVASGPGKDMYESAKIIGQRQFDKALEILNSKWTRYLNGEVGFRHTFVSMASLNVRLQDGTIVHTCPAALGYSFGSGTTDGPGYFDFTQGRNSTNKFWDRIAGFISQPTIEQVECHHPKPILLNTGYANLPYAWDPNIIPLSVFRVGSLLILNVPAAVTTMAGRRLRGAIEDVASRFGIQDPVVTIAGLSNSYAHYVTTIEEYSAQRYEGASTLYGPHTLSGYIQELTRITEDLLNGDPSETSSPPQDFSDKQISLIPPVLFDSVALGEEYGSVSKFPEESYTIGNDTVEITFRSANPRNGQRAEGTFLTVDQQMDDGNWTTKYVDGDWCTRFYWNGDDSYLGLSYAELSWEIPDDAQPGTYRICHYGARKHLLREAKYLFFQAPDWLTSNVFGSAFFGLLLSALKFAISLSPQLQQKVYPLKKSRIVEFSGCSDSFLVKARNATTTKVHP